MATTIKSQKKRILVVDDQADITRMLKLNLEQTNNYEVRTENNSSLALAAAADFHPDLILMDVVMPGMDGGHLASRLEASPELKGVPIVFLTATVTREEVRAHDGLVGGVTFPGQARQHGGGGEVPGKLLGLTTLESDAVLSGTIRA